MSRFRIRSRGRTPLRAVFIAGLIAAFATYAGARGSASGSRDPGYWLVATDGGVFNYGDASFHGSTGSMQLGQPMVGMAATPTGGGYWLVATDGGVFNYGDASFHGSTGSMQLGQPMVGMAATPTGGGYWLVAADGGIFAFGDARYHGSTGGQRLRRPIVDIASTPTGRGYWLVASDGGVFAFGDASFHGSIGDRRLVSRIHAMSPTRSGHGYWLLAGDGGVFGFGDADFYGSLADQSNERRMLDIAASSTGRGYYLVDSGGSVYPFGDAEFLGDARNLTLNKRVAGMAVVGGNRLPSAIDDSATVSEDHDITVDVLANDDDRDGDLITLDAVSQPGHGTARISGSEITYRPAPDFHGSDSFAYSVRDSEAESSSATVSVIVSPLDDRPYARADRASVKEGTQVVIPVLDNDHGLGDGGLRVRVMGPPDGGGSAAVTPDNAVIFRAERDGPESSTASFDYRVSDVDGSYSEATVTVAVTQLPRALDDLAATFKRQATTIDILRNDAGGNGVRSLELRPIRDAGSDLFSGDSNRTLQFQADRSGSFSVRYRFTDVDGDVSNWATVAVNVDNRRPEAEDDSGPQGVPIAVLANDGDPDGDQLRISRWGRDLRKELRGSVDCSSNDFTSCLYTPPKDGGPPDDRFEYEVTDGDGGSSKATVSLSPS